MNLNRDAGAVRSPSHTGPRPTRRPTNPNVDGAGVVDMPRAMPAVAVVVPRQASSTAVPRGARQEGVLREFCSGQCSARGSAPHIGSAR